MLCPMGLAVKYEVLPLGAAGEEALFETEADLAEVEEEKTCSGKLQPLEQLSMG